MATKEVEGLSRPTQEEEEEDEVAEGGMEMGRNDVFTCWSISKSHTG